MAGTRVLVVNVAMVAGLMKWPFSEETVLTIEDNRLPLDAKFIKIEKVDIIAGKVWCRLISDQWSGDSDEPLPNPSFRYATAKNQIVLPGALERALGKLS